MDEIKASAKIEFANLISLALEKSLPWSYLCLIVDKMSLDQGQFKNIIKVLLKELQQLQAKFQGKEEKEFSENLLTKHSGPDPLETIFDKIEKSLQNLQIASKSYNTPEFCE